MNMNGKVIAISGATGGLGPTVVNAFVQAGATLALIDRKQARLDALISSLKLPTERHLCQTIDLLNPQQTQGWIQAIEQRFGHIDGLLHLVGGYRGGQAIADFPDADWVLLNNLLSQTTWNVIHAFAAPLKASQGQFVLVSSPQAQRPSHTNAAYAACKAACEALTLALADEFRGSGATANIIQVNAILTPQMLSETPGGDYRTFTHADDIASAMVFLCSAAGKAMNGQRLALFEHT